MGLLQLCSKRPPLHLDKSPRLRRSATAPAPFRAEDREWRDSSGYFGERSAGQCAPENALDGRSKVGALREVDPKRLWINPLSPPLRAGLGNEASQVASRRQVGQAIRAPCLAALQESAPCRRGHRRKTQ